LGNVILHRLIIAVFLLLIVTLVTFVLIQMTPGNYFDQLRANPRISEELVESLEERYGVDDPVLVQYGRWLVNLASGDMGYSFGHQRPITGLLLERFGNTIFLMLASLFFTWAFALPLGIYAAVHHNRILDRIFSFFAFIGMSIPNFFLCFLLLYLASHFYFWPIGGMTSPHYAELGLFARLADLFQHMAIPVAVIATGAMAGLQRITRSNMLEVLRRQYILSARARGLPENRVIYRHALRNAVNPLITIFGYQFTTLVSGAALVEIIAGWPGMGQLMLESVQSRDQFVVVGLVLASGVLLILGNLVADILLAVVDPRVRFGARENV